MTFGFASQAQWLALCHCFQGVMRIERDSGWTYCSILQFLGIWFLPNCSKTPLWVRIILLVARLPMGGKGRDKLFRELNCYIMSFA